MWEFFFNMGQNLHSGVDYFQNTSSPKLPNTHLTLFNLENSSSRKSYSPNILAAFLVEFWLHPPKKQWHRTYILNSARLPDTTPPPLISGPPSHHLWPWPKVVVSRACIFSVFERNVSLQRISSFPIQLFVVLSRIFIGKTDSLKCTNTVSYLKKLHYLSKSKQIQLRKIFYN